MSSAVGAKPTEPTVPAVDFLKVTEQAAIASARWLGRGDHNAAEIVSAAFRGKTRVQQHQMVYAALKGKMGGQLHALALTTYTPEAVEG